MSVEDFHPWQHFKVAGRPEDWEWSITDQPGCPCNTHGDKKKPQPHDCYSVYFDVTESCAQGICRIGPGGALPYHSHEASEMYVPLKGSCTLYIDGQTTTISGDNNGEAIYLPSNCPHGLKNETDEEYEFFWVYYSKNGEKSDAKMQFQAFTDKAVSASNTLRKASTTKARSRKASVKVLFDKMSLTGDAIRKMPSSVSKLRRIAMSSRTIKEEPVYRKKSSSGAKSQKSSDSEDEYPKNSVSRAVSQEISDYEDTDRKNSASSTGSEEMSDNEEVYRKQSVFGPGSQKSSNLEDGCSGMPQWMLAALSEKRKSID